MSGSSVVEQYQSALEAEAELRQAGASSDVNRAWLRAELKTWIDVCEAALGSAANRNLHWYWREQLGLRRRQLSELEGA